MPEVHPHALSAFNKNAVDYDLHRPSYIAEAVDQLLAVTGIARLMSQTPLNVRVVDLGAGTGPRQPIVLTRQLANWFIGKLTQLLKAREIPVVAIEPSEVRNLLEIPLMHLQGMRETFKRVVPDVEIKDGSAFKIPLEDNYADAIYCAQAFHWFAKEEALVEIHRVLKPGGG